MIGIRTKYILHNQHLYKYLVAKWTCITSLLKHGPLFSIDLSCGVLQSCSAAVTAALSAAVTKEIL